MKTKQLFTAAGAARALAGTLFAAALLLSSSSVFAQVKIGMNPTTIATGSALEVEASNKGIRFPQVSLTSTIVFAPVAGVGTDATSPGMSVYNTNAATTGGTATNGTRYPAAGVGEYYWDGFGWVTKNSSKGFRLVWAGHSDGPYNYPNNGAIEGLATTEYYDSDNASTGGIFTVPYDAFYTITQNFRVTFNGPAGQSGSYSGFINVRPLATGVAVGKSYARLDSYFTYTYPYSQSITVLLKAGDKIFFSEQPCTGCAAGSSYDLIELDQTIAVFQ